MSAMTFAIQMGLARESVTVEGGELNMSTLKDIACAFIYRKVRKTILICTVLYTLYSKDSFVRCHLGFSRQYI